MARERLDPAQLSEGLEKLSGWALSEDGLAMRKTFVFADFRQAFAFMTECALVAEKLDHHPEWFNVYSRVEVMLTTHDAKGLTALDLKLAEAMERAASNRV